jgi:hypothetical protein
MTFSLSLKCAFQTLAALMTALIFSAALFVWSPAVLAVTAVTKGKKSVPAQTVRAENLSLFQQAVSESTTVQLRTDSQGRPVTPPKSATSAALTSAPEGMLRLKDSYDSKTLRTWNWRMGLNLQRFGAEGSYTSPNGESSNLNQVTKTWMPVLELGISSSTASDGFYSQGLLRTGYARQSLNLNTASGIDDASLSTLLLGLQPQVGYKTGPFGVGLLAEAGRLSYSQTGAGTLISGSNLNRSLDYLGYGLATHFMVSASAKTKVQAQLNWLQRQGRGEGKGRIQSSNIDAGIAVLW